MVTHSARIDGTGLSYVDEGNGRPVVLVHGGMSDQRVWDDHRPIIASRYRVIAATLRYFGTSPWSDDGRNFSVETHADDLAAFIRILDVGPVAVVGWSYGAVVSLAMVARHPGLAERLLLYEPGITTFVTDPVALDRATEDRLQVMLPGKAAVMSGDNEGAIRILTEGVDNCDGAFRQLPDHVQAIMLENARILPLLFASPPPPTITCEDLGLLGIPVGIAVGENSRVYCRIVAEAAHRCIPGSALIRVPNARHLWPSQDPAAFSRLVLDFLGNGCSEPGEGLSPRIDVSSA